MRIACHWLRLYIVYLRHPLYSWQQSDTGVWYYLIYKEVMEGVCYRYVLLILSYNYSKYSASCPSRAQ